MICLLTTASWYAILKLDLAGSGAGGSAASNKSWLGGETRKRPATFAVSVCHRLVSGYRGPDKDLKYEPAEARLWKKAPSVFGSEVCLGAARAASN